MKSCAITLGAFAVLGMAQASNIRGLPPMPGAKKKGNLKAMDQAKYKKFDDGLPTNLLARCQGNVKVEECCKDDPKDHSLYQAKNVKTAELPAVCCYKQVGTWMPTDKAPEKGKFCAITAQQNHAIRGARTSFDISRQLRHLLKRMIMDKREYRRAFKEAYIAHEKVEDSARGQLQLQKKEVSFKEEQAEEQRVSAGKASDQVNTAKGALDESANKFNTLVEKTNKAKANFEAKSKALADTLNAAIKELGMYNAQLGKCSSASADAKGNLVKANKEIETLKANAIAAADAIAAHVAERKKAEAALKKAQDDFEKQSAAAKQKCRNSEKKFKLFQSQYEKTKKETAATLQMLDEMMEGADGAAFVELKQGYKYLVDSAPTNVENDFYANAGKKGANGKVLTIKGQHELLDEAKDYVVNELDNTNTVLKKLKGMNTRILALKSLDQDLNKQILDSIGAKSAKLKAALVAAQKDLDQYSKDIEAATNALTALERKKTEMDNMYYEADMKEQKEAVDRSDKLNQISKKISDQMIKTEGLKTQFKECAKELKAAEKDLTVAKKQSSAAEKEVEAMHTAEQIAKNQINEAEASVEKYEDDAKIEMQELTRAQNDLDVKAREMMKNVKEARAEGDAANEKLMNA